MESVRNQSTRFEGRSVSLFRHDFEDLSVILAKGFNSVELATPGFRYQTFDEFLGNKRDDAPKELKLSLRKAADGNYAYDYLAEIRIGARTFTVETSSQRLEAIGAVASIFRFLDTTPRSRKVFNRRTHAILYWTGYGAILGVIAVLAVSDFRWHGVYFAGVWLGSLFVSLPICPGFLWRNKLRPQTERSSISWLEENRDKLVFVLIGTLLTLVCTKLVPWLLSHIVLK